MADNSDIFPSCPVTCPPNDCGSVFDRVVVSYLAAGPTRVLWSLRREFEDPRPLVFQLQVGRHRDNAADDWQDVGAPVTDVYYAVDPAQRFFGKVKWQFYRVLLTSPDGTYTSDPVGVEGTLDRESWRLARAALEAETIHMRAGDGELGYLLKRRNGGTPCPYCLDTQTDEVRQPRCPVCYGTGFQCGYYFPIGCVWADISPRSVRLTLDESRGSVADVVQRARMANPWLLAEEDVFVNKVTDDRYYVHRVDDLYTFRGVPIVANVELRPAPGSDVIYALAIPDQPEPLSHMALRAGGTRR